jgi:kanamycin kinase
MKRTAKKILLSDYPERFHALLSGAEIFDSSCSPEARVIMIDREGGCFLKSAPAGALAREAELDAYFHQKGLSAPVLDYCTVGERDWLLTARVRGEDLTHRTYLEDPRRLAILLGERLRALHETACGDCPVKERMKEYFATAEENYRRGVCDPSFYADYGNADADELYAIVEANRDALSTDVLLHGDYCLPNIMLDDWKFSGFIDLGNGGVGDRHVDIFWGAWTLNFNLKTDKYRERFLDAYGRDKIEAEMLRVIAAAESFG